jgi:hypothetical protein
MILIASHSMDGTCQGIYIWIILTADCSDERRWKKGLDWRKFDSYFPKMHGSQ